MNPGSKNASYEWWSLFRTENNWISICLKGKHDRSLLEFRIICLLCCLADLDHEQTVGWWQMNKPFVKCYRRTVKVGRCFSSSWSVEYLKTLNMNRRENRVQSEIENNLWRKSITFWAKSGSNSWSRNIRIVKREKAIRKLANIAAFGMCVCVCVCVCGFSIFVLDNHINCSKFTSKSRHTFLLMVRHELIQVGRVGKEMGKFLLLEITYYLK